MIMITRPKWYQACSPSKCSSMTEWYQTDGQDRPKAKDNLAPKHVPNTARVVCLYVHV